MQPIHPGKNAVTPSYMHKQEKAGMPATVQFTTYRYHHHRHDVVVPSFRTSNALFGLVDFGSIHSLGCVVLLETEAGQTVVLEKNSCSGGRNRRSENHRHN